jgi:uncharacterized membrane protein YkoI
LKKLNKDKVLPFAVLALVLAAGIGFVGANKGILPVHAQTAAPATQVATQNADAETADDANKQEDQNEQEPSYKSSITIADTNEQDEKTEQSKLANLAKITSDQAKAAAEKALGGTASEVKLENDGGNVVYAVTVGSKEAKVDAGNGSILHTEASDGETNDGGSTND